MNNNNNIEVLLKLIVPAIFVVVWTINSLFNKEIQNQQRQRSARPVGNPLGPRPGLPPLNRPTPSDPRPEPAGFGGAPPSPWRESDKPNEGVVVVSDADARAWAARQRAARLPQPQPQTKPQNSPRNRGGKARKPTPPPPEPNNGPRAIVTSHLSTSVARDAAASHDIFDAQGGRPDTSPSVDQLRGMLRDPVNIRQVFVLHEILSSPRSGWARLGQRR